MAEPAPTASELSRLLGDIGALIDSLSDAHYTRNPVGPFRCSIGAQVRHCLDHVGSLCSALNTGRLNYDHRERGTLVETRRPAALAAVADLEDRLSRLTRGDCDRTLIMTHLVCSALQPTTLLTSVSRELAFVQCHTIHHQATIAAMASLLDVEVPATFGYAPSTIAHLRENAIAEDTACAR